MRVHEAAGEERVLWDAFVASAPTGSFLQSWQWGVFQEMVGFPIQRLILHDDGSPRRPCGVCLFVHRPLPFGRHGLYAPWGPVTDAQNAERKTQTGERGGLHPTHLREMLEALRAYSTEIQPASIFVRVEPRIPPDEQARLVLKEAHFTPLGRGIQPKDTLVVDLTQTEDELLRGMHPKTRYNIRVAMRHGVMVREETSPAGLDVFTHLAREVERRSTFRYHPNAYYGTMLEVLHAVPEMFRILVASHRGTPLAVGLFITFGSTLTYAHGASSAKRPHVMAPALLHWEAIQEAKAAGLARYDLFGIAPTGDIRHPWAGITRFKRGFGGREGHFVGIADAVLDPLAYRLFTAARGLRAVLHR